MKKYAIASIIVTVTLLPIFLSKLARHKPVPHIQHDLVFIHKPPIDGILIKAPDSRVFRMTVDDDGYVSLQLVR